MTLKNLDGTDTILKLVRSVIVQTSILLAVLDNPVRHHTNSTLQLTYTLIRYTGRRRLSTFIGSDENGPYEGVESTAIV